MPQPHYQLKIGATIMEVSYHRVQVVGIHFRGRDVKELAASLPLGTELSLRREPENEHDQNAIMVYYLDTHIGYVNRQSALWIAPDMDEGVEYTALLVDYEDIVNGAGRTNRHPMIDVGLA